MFRLDFNQLRAISHYFSACRRVTLMEDDVGNVHLKNLSLHHAANEEEALNLLFVVGEFLISAV